MALSVPGFLMDPNILSIIVFLLVAAAVVWRDRENIERHSIIFVRRTQHGVELLTDVAQLWPRAWRIWSTIGIVAGFVLMVPMFLLIIRETLKLFLVADAIVPVQPLVPTASTFTNPATAGYFGIPFWYFMISISVVLVVHEMMHGVIARVEDFNVEYVGLLLIGILPGAFVQPEGQQDFFEQDGEGEEQEEKQSPWDQGNWVSRLRVLAAGPWANVTLSAILLGALFGGMAVANATMQPAVYEHRGMEITNVSQDLPAAQAGLTEGMVITHINGSKTYTSAQFQQAAPQLQVGVPITIATDQGNFTVTPVERPSRTNTTYRPALIDYILPTLEQQVPGAINTYEQYNNWIVPENTHLEVERWKWIKDREPALAQTADNNIARLEQQTDPAPGIIGVHIQPALTFASWLQPFTGAISILLQLVLWVGLINLFIGTANLLPVKGLDGGWMLSILLEHYMPEKEPRITRGVTIFTILLIGISFAFFLARFIT